MAKAVPSRSADPIKVALPRSGKVLQRSRNRFDSPMAFGLDSLAFVVADSNPNRL